MLCALALVVGASPSVAARARGCTLFDFGRPAAPVPARGGAYDRAGFWGDVSNGWTRQQAGSGRIVVDPHVTLVRGMSTVRLEVRPGDRIWGGERADVFYGGGDPAPAGPHGIREGVTQWWAWSTATSSSYAAQARVPQWNILMDFHQTGDAPFPNIVFGVDGQTRQLFLDAFGGETHDPHWLRHGVQRSLGRFVPGKRYDFALGVRWSSDARVGWIEVWLDGRRVVERTSAATLWRGQGVYPKLANYRAPGVANWANVVYHAGFRRGATRAAVMRCVTQSQTEQLD